MRIKNKKQIKKQLSKKIICFLVALMLYQPFLSGAYAYAEITRIQGRNVNMSLPVPLQAEDIYALSDTDQEALTDLDISSETGVQPTDEENEQTPIDEEETIYPDLDLRLPDLPAEPESPDGELVEIGEYMRTYDLGNGLFETIITSVPQTFTGRGRNVRQAIDNTLERRNPLIGRPYFRNRANAFEVRIPEEMEEGEGVRLRALDGQILELIPQFGDFTQLATLENAGRYNDVLDGIDVQYLVGSTALTQEIIFNRYVNVTEFEFELNLPNNQTVEIENGVVNIYADEELVQHILPPLITDGDGNVDLHMASWELEDTTLTLVVDESFLENPATVFPLSIATPLAGTTVTPPVLGMFGVQQGSPNTIIGDNNYPYTGYDDGIRSGNLANYDIAHRRTRTYVNIPTTIFDQISTLALEDGARIESATFSLSHFTTWSNGETQFAIYRIREPWNPGTLTWNNQIGINHAFAGAVQNATTAANVYIEWDVTDLVMDWMMGTVPNHGLVVKVLDESLAMQAEVWNNRHGARPPRFSFTWSVPYPVDPNFPLNDATIVVYPITESDASRGIQHIRAVFAAGMSTPGSMVDYRLDGAGVGGEAEAVGGRFSYRFPNTELFGTSMESNWRQIVRRDYNWQTTNLYRNFTFDHQYQYSAVARLDGAQSDRKTSDSFLIYQVRMMDTWPRIANHYGVTVSQLMLDNEVQDVLSLAGNTLFIRNPQTTQPFNPPPLIDADKRMIDGANAGRGNDSIFGFDPINLTNGNFFIEQEDVNIHELGGDFRIFRTYNVFSHGANGMFGRGWDFDFNRYLTASEDGNIIYFRGDGSFLQFERQDDTFITPRGHNYTLRQIGNGENDFGHDIFRWEIEDHDGTTYRFNGWGLLYEIETIQGFVTTIEYDENFKIDRVTSPGGAAYQFTTNARGQVMRIDLPNGGRLHYEYDEYDRLVSFTDAEGGVVRYVYDNLHRMTSWYDQNNVRVILNTYDAYHRVTSQRDANGFTAQLRYELGRVITIDNNGNETVYEVDEYDRLLRIIHSDGSVTEQAYDERGFHAVGVSQSGRVDRTFDTYGNMLTETRADGRTRSMMYNSRHQLIQEIDFYGRVRTYHYDSNGNLVETIFPDGTSERKTHDAYGNVVSRTDAMGFVTTYSFDGILMTSRTDALGNTTNFFYNSMNELIATVDPLGNITRQTFNRNGELVSRTAPDGGVTTYERGIDGSVGAIADARGNRTSFDFDGMGMITKSTNELGGVLDIVFDGNGNRIGEIDEEGNTTRFVYDELDRLIQEIDPDGGVTRMYYDAFGNMIRTVDPLGRETHTIHDVHGRVSQQIDVFGQVTETIYDIYGNVYQVITPTGITTNQHDIMGRLIETIDELGITTIFTHDANGNVIEENVNGRITRYEYDPLGRVIRTINPLGYYTTTEFDAGGNAIRTTDERGYTTISHFDAMGRQVRTIDALGNSTSRAFDLNGNIISETDANGNTTTYTFNALNLLISTTDALGNVTRVIYDANEQVASEIDALGNITRFYRDGRGNVVRTVDAAGGQWLTEYDVLGQVVSETDPEGNITQFIYNDLGLLIQEIDPDGYSTRTYYDEAGRVVRTVAPLGAMTHISYDSHGRVTREYDIFGQVTETIYNEWGNVVKVITPTGITTTEFDELSRVIRTTNEIGVTTTFTHDEVGNVVEENVDGFITTHIYDALGRAIQTRNPLGYYTTSEFDAHGNLIRQTDELGNSTIFEPDALNRSVRIIDAYGYYELSEFDAHGNLISEIDKNGNTTSHIFDALNRRIVTIDPLGFITQTIYTPNGRVASQIDPYGNETRFYYDGRGNVIERVDALDNIWLTEFDAGGNVTREVNPLGYETISIYNEQGLLTKQNGPNGLIVTYIYDGFGRLIREHDNAGRETTTAYDRFGRVIRQRDGLGRISQTFYDERGREYRFVSFTDEVLIYEFDALDRPIATIDGEGRRTEFVFDGVGNQIEIIDNEGYTVTTEFDALNRQVSVTNQLGYTTLTEYDAVGNITRETNALGYATTYRFNELNQKVEIIDALGNTTIMYYDGLGQIITTVLPNGGRIEMRYDALGNVVAESDANGHVTEHHHDELSRRTQTITPMGGRIYFEHDTVGNVIRQVNPLGGYTLFNYDLHGNMIHQTEPNGAQTSYEFDIVGRLISTTNPLGLETTNTYDQRDNLIRETTTLPDGTTFVQTFIYDGMNRLISETNALGGTTYHTYNARGHLVSTTNPLGYTSYYTFDVLERLVSTTNAYGYISTMIYDGENQLIRETFAGGREWQYIHDEVGNLLQTIDPMGYTQTNEFDAQGNIIRMTNALGHTREYEFDLAGNVIKETDERGHFTQFTYDAENRLVRRHDRKGNMTRFRWDLEGNMTSITDPSDRTTIFTHDIMGNTTSMRDPDGRVVRYEFDLLGNQTRLIHPDGTIEAATYNAQGQRASFTHPSGRSSIFTHDGMGNVIQIHYVNARGREIPDSAIYQEFDVMSQRIEMHDITGTSTYIWDGLGRLASVTFGNVTTVSYSYDEVGNVSEIIYPDGRSVQYKHDLNDRITSVTDVSGNVTTYTYNGLGQVLTTTHPTGIISTYSYDKEGLIENVTHTNASGETVASFTYERDELGRITREIATEGDVEVIRTFTYLPSGELSEFQEREGSRRLTHRYSYDRSGNRTQLVISGGDQNETIRYFYNDLNQLIMTDSTVYGRTEFTYDADGNLISRTNGDTVRTYEYDVENRLTAVRENGALLMAALYDGDGNRTFTLDRHEYVFYIDREYLDREQTIPNLPWLGGSKSTTGGPSRFNPEFVAPETRSDVEDDTVTIEIGERTVRNYGELRMESTHHLDFFWYGFVNGIANTVSGPVGMTMATNHVRDWWNSQRTFTWSVVDTREVINDSFDERDMDIMRQVGLTDRDFEMIGRPVTRPDMQPGQNPNIGRPSPNFPSGEVDDWTMSDPLVPDREIRYYFELSYFVNDVNQLSQEHVQVLATYGKRNELRHTYTYGNQRLTDERLSNPTNSIVTDTFLHDGRTSVIGITCERGNVLDRFRYDPFGNMTMGQPLQGIIFGFNGEQYNVTTGYQYLRARYYGVHFGRFLTRDTFLGSEEDPLSLNRYSYVHNDPVNNTDPTGHWAQGAPVHAFSIGQGSNLNSSDWQRVHRDLIRLGYRGSNNAPLQVAGSPNQHTEHAIRRFRTRNNIAPVTGRVMRGDRTHSRLLSSAARGEATAVPAPQIRAVVPTRRAPNQAEWRRVQTRLNELGYRGVDNRPVPVSGRLDHHTSSALTRFRVRNSISPTSQPLIVDDVTWNRLMNARAPVREVVRSTTPVVSTARPVQTTPGKTNPTANLRDSDVARKITGDKYEPPTYIRVLGFRIRIPASIANVFLNRSGGSTARASGVSEALEADEGYIGIEATSVIVIVGGGILLGGLFVSAAAVSAIITIAVIVLAVIAIALLIELVVVPIVNALRMSIAESTALRMELQSRSLSNATTGERVMDLPGTGTKGKTGTGSGLAGVTPDDMINSGAVWWGLDQVGAFVDSNTQANRENEGEQLTTIYRSVSSAELRDIRSRITDPFRAGGGFEGKLFGFDRNETIQFALLMRDPYVIRVMVATEIFRRSHSISWTIDEHIFKSGVAVVSRENLPIFNTGVRLVDITWRRL